MSAVLLAGGGAQAAQAGLQAIQAGRKLGVEIVGYDFVGLLVKVIFFQIVALLIAKYVEGVLGANNFLKSLAALLGFGFPNFLPQPVADFFQNGYQGIRYWDVVKLATVGMIAIELNQYVVTQKRLGAEPSAVTVGVFLLVIGFFFLITLPELVQRVKDAAAMSAPENLLGDREGEFTI